MCRHKTFSQICSPLLYIDRSATVFLLHILIGLLGLGFILNQPRAQVVGLQFLQVLFYQEQQHSVVNTSHINISINVWMEHQERRRGHSIFKVSYQQQTFANLKNKLINFRSCCAMLFISYTKIKLIFMCSGISHLFYCIFFIIVVYK